ncbi:hypothetical protein BDN72DRAFT_832691 [Pluteus cervinus]|uniref:Uncharacterized protein n=1 Tax=Pluteus cervinus TaxID=181527 RepID=A0ACD3BBM8_9AGAR|nr:hypothetical protein BDN72DRAFT_832691 [Pluteus cervinus]
MHALCLHRDPNRGDTHILWYGVKYTPDAGKDVGQKFTIETASVFKITDVLTEIEKSRNLNKREGREFIDEASRTSLYWSLWTVLQRSTWGLV